MKKLILILLLVSFSFAAFAEIPVRKFELGSTSYGGFANNSFIAGDFLQQTLVIDFNKIVKDIGKDGFKFNGNAGYNSFFNLNLPGKIDGGLFMGVNSSMYTRMPTDLFDLVATGNKLDKEYKDSFDMATDVTFEMGARYSRQIGPVKASIRPALFTPLISVSDSQISYTMQSTSAGLTEITGTTDVSVCSPFSLEEMSKGLDTGTVIGKTLAASGLDLALSAEYPLMTMLDLGATLKGVPVVPSRMAYRARYSSTFSFKMDNLLQNYDDSLFKTSSGSESAFEKKTTYVLRPFKVGVTASYRPLSTKLVTLTPDLAMAIYHDVYVDGGVQAKLDIMNLWILTLDSRYVDKVWRQSIGSTLNFRLIQFDTVIGSQSQSFLKSFQGAGFYASLGTRIGY